MCFESQELRWVNLDRNLTRYMGWPGTVWRGRVLGRLWLTHQVGSCTSLSTRCLLFSSKQRWRWSRNWNLLPRSADVIWRFRKCCVVADFDCHRPSLEKRYLSWIFVCFFHLIKKETRTQFSFLVCFPSSFQWKKRILLLQYHVLNNLFQLLDVNFIQIAIHFDIVADNRFQLRVQLLHMNNKSISIF